MVKEEQKIPGNPRLRMNWTNGFLGPYLQSRKGFYVDLTSLHFQHALSNMFGIENNHVVAGRGVARNFIHLLSDAFAIFCSPKKS